MRSGRSISLLRSFARFGTLAVVAVACCLGTTRAVAQNAFGGAYMPPAPTTDPLPELEGVTIDDLLSAGTPVRLPLDTKLVDDHGKTVALRDVLAKDRPTILQIGYMRCPQLCSLVMNALLRSMRKVDLVVGTDYDVISLSINPEEKFELAAGKKAGYVAEYGRAETAHGWHFMTGEEANVRAVAESVGFKYTRQANGEYSHAAAVFLITPDGRLSRVLYGVAYEPQTLRMGLLEAGEGKIGSTIDRFILWCHIYDASAGGYIVFAMRLMQLGGAVTVVVMAGGLAWFWTQDARRKRLAPPGSSDTPQSPQSQPPLAMTH